MDPITSAGSSLLPFTIALGAFVVVSTMLGVLLATFVYQLRNDMRRAAESLDALNSNIERALSHTPSEPARIASPRHPKAMPALDSFPDEASIEAKARFLSIGRT